MSHLKNLFEYLIDLFRSFELKEGFKFIISILTLYMLFWFLLQLIGLGPLKSLTAQVSSKLLNIVGVSSSVSYGASPVIHLSNSSVRAAIVDLCVGDIELALLPAIILSTFDRSIRRRIVGVISRVLLILVINPLRIFLVLSTGSWFSWRIAELLHSFTFRLTLVIIILAFYYIWYLKYGSIARWVNEKIKRE